MDKGWGGRESRELRQISGEREESKEGRMAPLVMLPPNFPQVPTCFSSMISYLNGKINITTLLSPVII